ncbi:MAG TPA: ribosome silencing factor [Anaerolineae bacterium]|nr:ribosome silencing factor [Anaerolineae bacterium]
MVELAASVAADKQASDIVIIDISNISIITDYFLICSGQTSRQVETIVESIEERLRDLKVRKIGLEGDRDKTWILLDFGSVVIHVFTQEQREYYQLERLWADAPHRKWEETG